MKKLQIKNNAFVYIYGAIIIFQGLFLLFSEYTTFETIKFTSGITLIVGAVFSFLAASYRQMKPVTYFYHTIHALAMLAYGVSILIFANTIGILLNLSAFLFLFYAFSEIIFCNWLLNLKNKVVYKILMVRISLALLVGVGAIVIMNYYITNDAKILGGYGLLFILIGVNIFLHVPIMKASELKESGLNPILTKA